MLGLKLTHISKKVAPDRIKYYSFNIRLWCKLHINDEAKFLDKRFIKIDKYGCYDLSTMCHDIYCFTYVI